MAHVGQVIENPVSGERIVFRQTAAETGGGLLEFDLFLRPDGKVPGSHRHSVIEERFAVLAGQMRFRLGGRTATAGPGDVVTVAPGTVHRFANASGRPVHVRVQARPALRMEQLLEAAATLAWEGRTLPNGLPKPLDFALFLREFEREVSMPFVPQWLVRTLTAPLVWIGCRLGLDRRYRWADATVEAEQSLPAAA